MTHAPVEPWLLEAARRRAGRFADQLRTVTDGTVRVPNLEWTITDLAQHVAALPWHFRDLHNSGEGFDTPDDWSSWSDGRRAHITETDTQALAHLIEREYASILDELEAGPNPRWFYGFQTSPTTIAAMLVNEAVMHGRDLAGATGADRPTLDENEAHAVANATMLAAHVFVDPHKAATQPDGIYHVKFRNGKDFTYTKQGGELIVTEGKPQKADAHLNADAATFVLSSLGRISQTKAALTGGVIAYGRKPWRFFGIGNMIADGV